MDEQWALFWYESLSPRAPTTPEWGFSSDRTAGRRKTNGDCAAINARVAFRNPEGGSPLFGPIEAGGAEKDKYPKNVPGFAIRQRPTLVGYACPILRRSVCLQTKSCGLFRHCVSGSGSAWVSPATWNECKGDGPQGVTESLCGVSLSAS